ncbi:uncharacterized protein MELLADRAFT_71865 [Melampsora larici-populina 98AG31]|uniref:Uncharacterized protein n=1 Tax=Melampsora larici-populina (strain 98AG31 / pathotype 3-4-7) TaxID=747676 RepID=F4RLC2_MELLP|nr:uncharacterized protein MELLADRAFT_71865 [Melampsora larici-populina 98AG31]EGG06896.1 hypothetical protein MELLADRAFT_71865 [Melampsora larici-populina 98AG31]
MGMNELEEEVPSLCGVCPSSSAHESPLCLKGSPCALVVERLPQGHDEEIDMLETSVGEDQLHDDQCDKKSIPKVGIEDGNEKLIHSCYHHHHHHHHHQKAHQNLTSELSELDDC